MRRFLFALVAFATFGAFGAFALEPGVDNGFGLRLGFSVPNKGYGLPKTWKEDNETDKYYRVWASYGLAMDNRWYVWHNNSFGTAIDVRWLDFDYGITKKKVGDVESKCWVADLVLFSPGAIFTWYFDENFALDLQYNFAPNVMGTSYNLKKSRRGTENDIYAGWGFAHVFGASLRWRILHVGFEQKIASMRNIINTSSSFTTFNNRFLGNRSRIFIGIKLCKTRKH